MAFENVYLRTATGETYGPVTWQELHQWHQANRVPANGVIIDAASGQEYPVSSFPTLQVAPPPVAGYGPPPSSGVSGMDHLIPTKNPFALYAYYGGILGLLFCFMGPVVIYLGIRGLKDVEKVGVGRTHSIVGIVLGCINIAELLGFILIIVNVARSSP